MLFQVVVFVAVPLSVKNDLAENSDRRVAAAEKDNFSSSSASVSLSHVTSPWQFCFSFCSSS